MMKDKKRLPQMIALGVLVAFCAGYLVVKAIGGKSTGPAKDQTAVSREAKNGPAERSEVRGQRSEPQRAPTSVPGKGGQQVAPGTTVTVAQAVQVAHAGRDPFSPQMNLGTTVAPPPPPPNRTYVARKLPADIYGSYGPLPPFGSGATAVRQQGPTQADTQQNPPVEPLPQFVLTGVITGRSNVAIIRQGEGRYIVKEGQTIDGTYKVVSVSQDGVLLAHGSRSMYLKLGGDGNGS